MKVAPFLARTSPCAHAEAVPFAVAFPLPGARGTSVCLTAPDPPPSTPAWVLQVENPSLLLQPSKAPASRHGLK